MNDRTKKLLERVVKLGTQTSWLNGRCELGKDGYEDLRGVVKEAMECLKPTTNVLARVNDIQSEKHALVERGSERFSQEATATMEKTCREYYALASRFIYGDSESSKSEHIMGINPNGAVIVRPLSGGPVPRDLNAPPGEWAMVDGKCEPMWRGYLARDVIAVRARMCLNDVDRYCVIEGVIHFSSDPGREKWRPLLIGDDHERKMIAQGLRPPSGTWPAAGLPDL